MRAARNKRVMVLSFGRFVGWKYTTQKLKSSTRCNALLKPKKVKHRKQIWQSLFRPLGSTLF